jgi:hypothetical protein
MQTLVSELDTLNTRYHSIREYVEDGFIEILFVKKVDNDSDLFTKNVNKDTNKRHVVKLLVKIDG